MNRLVFSDIQLFLERLAYWLTRTILIIYLIYPVEKGGLELTPDNRIFLLGTITFLATLLPIFLGRLCDRIGSRKAMIIALTLDLISILLLFINPFLPSGHLVFAAFSAVLIGIGSGLFYPAIYGNIAQDLNPQEIGVRFGIAYFIANVAGFLGPLINLMDSLNEMWLIEFSLAAGLLILNLALTCTHRDSQPLPTDQFISQKPYHSILYKLLPMPKLLLIFLGILGLFMMVENMLDTQTRDLFIASPLAMPRYLNLILQGLSLLLIIPLTLWFSKYKFKTGFLCSMGLIFTGGVTAGLAGGNIAGAIGLFVMQCGAILWSIKLLEYLAKVAPENRKATYMGFTKLPSFMALLLSYIPLFLFTTGNVPAFYWMVCIVLGVISIAITIFFLKKHDLELGLN